MVHFSAILLFIQGYKRTRFCSPVVTTETALRYPLRTVRSSHILCICVLAKNRDVFLNGVYRFVFVMQMQRVCRDAGTECILIVYKSFRSHMVVPSLRPSVAGMSPLSAGFNPWPVIVISVLEK
jgi:hypothetical protein